MIVSFFDRMKAAGINITQFNPVDPAKLTKKLTITQRDHRKVLVVDGRVGITGGVNVSSVYSRSSSPSAYSGKSKEGWRDTDVMMEGPAVAELQSTFIHAWRGQKGPPLPELDYFPRLEAEGSALVQVVSSFPGETHRTTYVMYVAALQNALYSIDLTTPYFVPDHQTMEAITDAARRGVRVRIVLPRLSDSYLTLNAGRARYEHLLKCGVKVYERRGRMIHAKTAVIDGAWSTVGSANFDTWSFVRDNEINVVVINTRFADELERLFEQDLAASDEITQAKWSERPVSQKVKEFLARLISPWL